MYVQPPLLENEMVTLFANTFKSPYYEHMMSSSTWYFYDVVIIAERIEQEIKAGRWLVLKSAFSLKLYIIVLH